MDFKDGAVSPAWAARRRNQTAGVSMITTILHGLKRGLRGSRPDGRANRPKRASRRLRPDQTRETLEPRALLSGFEGATPALVDRLADRTTLSASGADSDAAAATAEVQTTFFAGSDRLEAIRERRRELLERLRSGRGRFPTLPVRPPLPGPPRPGFAPPFSPPRPGFAPPSRPDFAPRPTPPPVSAPIAGQPNATRNIVFRTEGDRAERLDVYLPGGEAPEGGWPVIVAIHGGGWRQFSKEHFGPKVAPLTELGYAVVVPSFTLSTPSRTAWPENFEDVREAVRWVRREADAFGFDAGRIAALGESSGAQLAMLLGTVPDGATISDTVPPPGPGTVAPGEVSGRVDAVIDFFGPMDLASVVSDSGGGLAAVQLIGARPEQAPARFAAASPVSHLSPDDAPVLVIHGTADPVVSYSQSLTLIEGLKAQGVSHRVIELPGAGHGFAPTSGNLEFEIDRFLRETLG